MAHGTDYLWKVATTSSPWFIPGGENIQSATLTINDLNNWAIEDDYMDIYLLNNPYIHPNWPTKLLLTTYTDTNESDNVNPIETFTYNLTASQISTLTAYLSDGKFGIGFDPNCHYYNNSMTFTVTTRPVPEPTTMLLLGLGLIGLAGVRRITK
jgi:hypothetical protein